MLSQSPYATLHCPIATLSVEILTHQFTAQAQSQFYCGLLLF